jgi:hypothetical protein
VESLRLGLIRFVFAITNLQKKRGVKEPSLQSRSYLHGVSCSPIGPDVKKAYSTNMKKGNGKGVCMAGDTIKVIASFNPPPCSEG